MLDADCADCEAASRRLHYGFMSQCPGCIARSIARGQSFRRVQQAGILDSEYLALLETMGTRHEAVKAASLADWATKRRKPADNF